MNIINIDMASDAIKQAHQKLEEMFNACNKDSSAVNLNGFTVAANELAHAVVSEGYTHLLLDADNRILIAAARERTPKAQLFITNIDDATEAPETTTTKPQAQTLVQTYQKDSEEDIRYISLKKWSDLFYLKEADFQSIDYDDFDSAKVVWILHNMKLAFNLFMEGQHKESLRVLSSTAEHVTRGKVDCVLMPRPEHYHYDDDDELVQFCRFVGNNKPFGFTVCHQKPMKRNQPEPHTKNNSFSFPHHGTANLAIASTIPSASFTAGHEDRYNDVNQLVQELLKEYITSNLISVLSLGELLNLSRKYAKEDGSQKELSFSSIKIGRRLFEKICKAVHNDDIELHCSDADYALIVESLVTYLEANYEGYPISFKYHLPNENQ